MNVGIIFLKYCQENALKIKCYDCQFENILRKYLKLEKNVPTSNCLVKKTKFTPMGKHLNSGHMSPYEFFLLFIS